MDSRGSWEIIWFHRQPVIRKCKIVILEICHQDIIRICCCVFTSHGLISVLFLVLFILLLRRLPAQLKRIPNSRTLDFVGHSQPICDSIYRRLYGSVDEHGGCRTERRWGGWRRRRPGCCGDGGGDTSLNGSRWYERFANIGAKDSNDYEGG